MPQRAAAEAGVEPLIDALSAFEVPGSRWQSGDSLLQMPEAFLRQRVGEPEGDELKQPNLVAMRQITA